MKFALPILVTTALSLTACGQKGPLYLPEPAAVVNNHVPETIDSAHTSSTEVSEETLTAQGREVTDE